ncbi:DUF4956 domain-containing protein [Eubacteriales bacterium OttesenSCG-928-N14]|nr:DUF4956 domain-containing protein [Eubacteriales bacterium OttesenSCG-928-N14]
MGSVVQSFLDSFSFGDIGIPRIVLTLVFGFVIGLYIYFIYRRTFAGVMYNKNFGVSLVMLTMVTAFVILPITSNLTLSLGMVGALSVVRFRTAVKDPLDTIYMFWAIAAGLTLGAKFYLPALVASLILGALLLLLAGFRTKASMPYLLVLRYDEQSGNAVNDLLRKMPAGKMKSKTVTKSGVELTMEMRFKENDMGVVERFLRIPGVYDAAIISYSGDIVA